MVFQPVADGLKIEQIGVQNDVPVVNVFYAAAVEDHDAGLLESVADTVYDWYVANRTLWHESYTLQSIVVTDVAIANGIQFILPVTVNGAGLDSGEPAAANAAVCASLRTGFTGRSFRGRYYFGGLGAAAFTDAQHISVTAAGLFSGAIVDLIDALEAVGAIMSVCSRVANLVQRVTAILTEITSVLVDTKIDSQRRRTAN